jgi:indolepyruvate decarboxylase
MSNPVSVADYIVARFAALGIQHAFGVPGDYSFPLDDAIESSKQMKWIGCSNELNAAYAADGYARVRGVSLLCTTFGVGELSALNGVMGARAEHLPVFHLVGHPSQRLQRVRAITHHTLGDGDFHCFKPLSAAACCTSAELTPQNCILELERVIEVAVAQSQPAYLHVAQDLALMPVMGIVPTFRVLEQIPGGTSDPAELGAATESILDRLEHAERPLAFVAHRVGRYRLVSAATAFLEKAGIAFVTTPMDKTTIDQHHPLCVGVYNGNNSSQVVKEAVETSDCIFDLGGVVWSDFNTGLWTQKVEKSSLIQLLPHEVREGDDSFGPVWLGDVLDALTVSPRTKEFPKWNVDIETVSDPLTGAGDDPISAATFYPRIQRFLRPRDIVICETGACVLRLATIKLPQGASFYNQTLWGSIGWSTPASLGTSLAAPDRRTILVTGDGSHQMTANEIGVMGRYGVKPIIFVLNNGIYGIAEVLNKTTGHEYDDLAPWNYADIPAAMGCRDWFTARVTTINEVDQALVAAAQGNRAAYIEVVLGLADTPHSLPPQVLDSVYRTLPNRRP